MSKVAKNYQKVQNVSKSCDYAIMSANLGVLYIGIGYIFWQQSGNMRQLEGVCAPFVRGVGECTFCNMYIGIGYILLMLIL